MELYKGLPIFAVNANDATVFSSISLVDIPAIETDFIKLAKEDEVGDLKLSINEEKKFISGPALIPDFPIYRKDSKGHKFYVKFDEEAILRFAEMFFKNNRQNEGNVMHQIAINGVTFFESYLINKERGIVPIEFKDLPNGSWIVSAKIENEDVWKLVKEGVLRGFSVDIENVSFDEIQNSEITSLKQLIDYINK